MRRRRKEKNKKNKNEEGQIAEKHKDSLGKRRRKGRRKGKR